MRKKDAASIAALGAGAALGLFGAACVLVAPRAAGKEQQREWEYLRRFRYAHRGLYDPALGIPENSLAAFERAAKEGFGSELDVHLAADGNLVVIHDSDVSRMTGATGIVEDMTYEQLSELRLDGTDERIPLFSEVLGAYERLGQQLPLIVEIKTWNGDYDRLTAATMAEIDRHDLTTCVESFDPRVLRWLRLNRPDVFRGQLSQNFLDPDNRSGHGALGDAVATMLLANVLGRPDFIAYRHADADRLAVQLATQVMDGCYVGWTLHSEEELLDCEGGGGIGIFEGFVPDPASSAYPSD